jgi:hypothetical protein
MLDGLWILKIQRPELTSGGVVVFINGKVFGGDNGFTWVGTYEGNDRLLKAQVLVHNFDPDIQSVLGISGDYELYFSGNIQGDMITGTAMLANQPQKSLAIKLMKAAAL